MDSLTSDVASPSFDEKLEIVSNKLSQLISISWQLRALGIFVVATPDAIEKVKNSQVLGCTELAAALEIGSRNFSSASIIKS